MTAYGIDLGTTFSSAATIVDTGGIPRTQVIKINQRDSDTMESVVFIDTRGDRLIASVGGEARDELKNALGDSEGSASPAQRFFEITKRDIGRHHGAESGWPRVVGGRGFLPEHIASLILRKLKQDVTRTHPAPVEKVVITHPYYFTEPQKAATREAGRLARLDVIDTLNEPTAAALAYGVMDSGAEGKYLIFDLGGGTLDVTLIELTKGRIDVLRGEGDAELGGYNWDCALLEHFGRVISRKYPEFDIDSVDIDPLTKVRLREKAVETKVRLSKHDVMRATLDVVFRDGSTGSERVVVSRQELEEMGGPLVANCRRIADAVMEGTGGRDALKWSELREVLMVGGATHDPAVRRMIRDKLGRSPKTEGFDPNTIVAQGAAYYALRAESDEALRRSVQRGEGGPPRVPAKAKTGLAMPKLRDATARGIGIGVHHGDVYVVDPLIAKSTPTPHRTVKTYYTLEANQREIRAYLYEGESADPENCTRIGECVLRDLPPGMGGQPVEVSFEVGASGSAKVFVKHVQSGLQMEQVIQRESAARAADGDAAEWLWSDVEVL